MLLGRLLVRCRPEVHSLTCRNGRGGAQFPFNAINSLARRRAGLRSHDRSNFTRRALRPRAGGLPWVGQLVVCFSWSQSADGLPNPLPDDGPNVSHHSLVFRPPNCLLSAVAVAPLLRGPPYARVCSSPEITRYSS